ncbi:MAG: type II/IV secretion system protein [Oscillatoriales cyanobacterium SM2_1_8]|nr:type II/IV secretion system protein [Oscillatoriales cyanobacterium SM2_1_8]
MSPIAVAFTSNPLSAWRQLQIGNFSLEQVLHMLVDTEGEIHQEMLDEEVSYRFFQSFDERGDIPPLVPLLLWRGKFYLGCPRSLNDGELQMICGRTRTGIEIISISAQSYLKWHLRQNLPTQGEIEIEAVVNPLTGEEDSSKLEEITELYLAQAIDQTNRIDAIISIALQHRASDIHFEPIAEGLRVRCRIDGSLRLIKVMQADISRKIVIAIKVMANMDIAESRIPQDGRIGRVIKSGDGILTNLDIRVSTFPCVGGEKVVMRLLHRKKIARLHELGFEPQVLEHYESILIEPQGMIVVTGPTGSGKTTTLYASLRHLANDTVNIVTIEDPVEYTFPFITQGQVQPHGMDFANGLRSILRQDPDIIVVGEIRDKETAVVAMRAALTGHLVLTTMHTNDAIGAIFRLKDFGLTDNVIGEGLVAVLAQRLVRGICSKCGETHIPSPEEIEFVGLKNRSMDSKAPWRKGKGCERCFFTGYYGQEALIELLPIKAEIFDRSYDNLRKELNNLCKFTLFTSAKAKILQGKTTVEEVKRVLASSLLPPTEKL